MLETMFIDPTYPCYGLFTQWCGKWSCDDHGAPNPHQIFYADEQMTAKTACYQALEMGSNHCIAKVTKKPSVDGDNNIFQVTDWQPVFLDDQGTVIYGDVDLTVTTITCSTLE